MPKPALPPGVLSRLSVVVALSLGAALLTMMDCAARAQTYRDLSGTIVPGQAPLVGCSAGGICAGPVSSANPLPVAGTIGDSNSAAFTGAVAMTVGTTYAAQRSVRVIATVAGNVVFQFPDGSTIAEQVYLGGQTFPYACTQIMVSGTTATASYWNLK